VLGHLQKPLTAILVYESLFWFWHIPRFYNLALLNDAIHLVEHACMAFAALNFWPLLLPISTNRRVLDAPVRIVLIGLMMTFDMILSAALTYSGEVWYAYEKLALPHFWPWDRLDDQRLGGIIMWVPGSFIWLVALIYVFAYWMLEGERDATEAIGLVKAA
jgi:putative membrane protein